jgi:hypothetical protein
MQEEVSNMICLKQEHEATCPGGQEPWEAVTCADSVLPATN